MRLRLSLNMIVCICRGATDRDIRRAIDRGAESVRDLQRCGIGDCCGSCHNSLRAILAASAAQQPCPVCLGEPLQPAVAAAPA